MIMRLYLSYGLFEIYMYIILKGIYSSTSTDNFYLLYSLEEGARKNYSIFVATNFLEFINPFHTRMKRVYWVRSTVTLASLSHPIFPSHSYYDVDVVVLFFSLGLARDRYGKWGFEKTATLWRTNAPSCTYAMTVYLRERERKLHYYYTEWNNIYFCYQHLSTFVVFFFSCFQHTKNETQEIR